MVGPIVSVAGLLPPSPRARTWLLEPVPPSTTSPVPESVWVPSKYRQVHDPLLASVSVAFNSRPFVTLSDCPLPIVTSELSVAPSRVPPPAINCAPPLAVIVPPRIVPPVATVTEPLVASSANVDPVLSSVPLRLTVPPVPSNVPKPANVKVPPRFSVPPLLALKRPLLLQFAPLTVIALPGVSASIVPWLMRPS